MEVKESGDTLRFTMETEQGTPGYPIPRRRLTLRFRDVQCATAFVDGERAELRQMLTDRGQNETLLELDYQGAPVTVELRGLRTAENLPLEEEAVRIITKYQLSNDRKNFGALKRAVGHFDRRGILPSRLDGPIEELRNLARP